MYDIMKRVISAGNYNLPKVLNNISTAWAEGSITDEQREELTKLAQGNADPAKGVDLLKKVAELESRIKALEQSNAAEDDAEEYPAYVDGKWYYNGDKCSENGKNYTCTAPEGVACVWSPSNYPPYWKEDV